MAHEWVTLANLFLLLMGFALLSRHFEESRIPDEMPALLPDDWKGGVVLLVLVFVLSSFLDNIAAALIGGTVARQRISGQGAYRLSRRHRRGVERRRIRQRRRRHHHDHDVDRGVSPLSVVEAYVAAIVAMMIFAVPASIQQQRFSPIARIRRRGLKIDRRPRVHRRGHPDCGAGRQHHREPEISGPARTRSRFSASRSGR